MKQIYIAGPSGSGKTTLCKRLSESEDQLVHVSLDKEVTAIFDDLGTGAPTLETRGQAFWEFSKKVLDNLSQTTMSDIVLLIDLDGDAAYVPDCQAFLIDHCASFISITGEPDVTYERASSRAAQMGNPPQAKEDFVNLEYSPAMQRLVQAAAIRIDTSTDTLEMSQEQFRAAVYKIAKGVEYAPPTRKKSAATATDTSDSGHRIIDQKR